MAPTIVRAKHGGTSIGSLGTGIATALGINVGTSGSPVVNSGGLGTPSSGVATNLTGTASGLTAGNAVALSIDKITTGIINDEEYVGLYSFSNSTSYTTVYQLGRISAEMTLGVVAHGGAYFNGASVGDVVLTSNETGEGLCFSNGKRTLQAGYPGLYYGTSSAYNATRFYNISAGYYSATTSNITDYVSGQGFTFAGQSLSTVYGTSYAAKYTVNGGGIEAGTIAHGSHVWSVNNAQAMNIAGNTGYLGVNQASPAERVDVGGNIKSSGSIKSTSASAGIGYGPGSGGTVTQSTDKSTAVTINKINGKITTSNSSLINATTTTFTVYNSVVEESDGVDVALVSGGTANSYIITCVAIANGSFAIQIRTFNASVILSDALVIKFIVTKGSDS